VRHAHALEGADDAARPLSAKGRAQLKRLAAFLRANGAFAPDEIWHSGLVRAHETAGLLARRLKLTVPQREVAGLKPEDNPKAIARRAARAERAIALVGHEPHLSALASLLVAGEAEPPVFEMKKGAVLALARVTGRWVVRWQVSPEVLA
jgi:phosphohistidine phosphatase